MTITSGFGQRIHPITGNQSFHYGIDMAGVHYAQIISIADGTVVYAGLANYTDSGKLFGGMLEVRNTVEAVLLVLLLGYPELFWLPVQAAIKIVIMVVTLLPLGILALMGISGGSWGSICITCSAIGATAGKFT
jgi:hypothetical protein